jgi:hypothetical protein
MRWDKASPFSELLHQEDLDIDWPAVQRELGVDCVEWLLKQNESECQLALEFTPAGHKQLVAEFFNDKLAVTYHMMWGR